MDPLSAGITLGANLLGGAFGASAAEQQRKSAEEINQKNLEMQRENLDWEKSVQATTWNREDNAVQRRSADLAAAGINPLLAAGSAANAGQVVRTDAPQLDIAEAGYSGGPMRALGKAVTDSPAQVMQMQGMLADVEVKKAQAQLLRAQASGAGMSNDVFSVDNLVALDAARNFRVGDLRQNPDVRMDNALKYFTNATNFSVYSKAAQSIQASATEALVNAGVDKAKADALASGYTASLIKNNLTVSDATVPASIAEAYAKIIGSAVGAVSGATGAFRNLTLSDYLRSKIEGK